MAYREVDMWEMLEVLRRLHRVSPRIPAAAVHCTAFFTPAEHKSNAERLVAVGKALASLDAYASGI